MITIRAIPAALALLALSVPVLPLLCAWAVLQFFSSVCHQDAARSFWIAGAPAAVCARCLGIYAGAAFGAWMEVKRGTALRLAGFAVALNSLEWLAGGSSLPLRFALGTFLGSAVAALLAGRILTQQLQRRTA